MIVSRFLAVCMMLMDSEEKEASGIIVEGSECQSLLGQLGGCS